MMLVHKTLIHVDSYPRPAKGRFACCGGWELVLDMSWSMVPITNQQGGDPLQILA